MFKNLIRRLTGKNSIVESTTFCESCGEVCNKACQIDHQFLQAQRLRERTMGTRVSYL